MLVVYLFCWLCQFSFFWNRRSDGFIRNISFLFTFFVNHVSIPFFDNRVSSSDQCMFGIIQIPTFFLTFSLGVSDSLGNGQMVLDDMISVLDIFHPVNSGISAWYSPPC